MSLHIINICLWPQCSGPGAHIAMASKCVLQEIVPVAANRAVLAVQGSAKEVPKLFNPAEEYDDKSVLLVTLSQKTITLTAKEVTGMPWPQFVRLMKVRADSNFTSLKLMRQAQSWRTAPPSPSV